MLLKPLWVEGVQREGGGPTSVSASRTQSLFDVPLFGASSCLSKMLCCTQNAKDPWMQHLGGRVICYLLKELYFSRGAVVCRWNAPVFIFFSAAVLSQETFLHPSRHWLPSLRCPVWLQLGFSVGWHLANQSQTGHLPRLLQPSLGIRCPACPALMWQLTFFVFIGVWLLYGVVFVYGVQQSESVIHIHKSCLTLWTYELYPARLFCPWDSSGKNIGC